MSNLVITISEIWDALRAAAEADLSLAQAIVDSAGVVVTSADMTMCYDERGMCILYFCFFKVLWRNHPNKTFFLCRCQVWTAQVCFEWAHQFDSRQLMTEKHLGHSSIKLDVNVVNFSHLFWYNITMKTSISLVVAAFHLIFLTPLKFTHWTRGGFSWLFIAFECFFFFLGPFSFSFVKEWFHIAFEYSVNWYIVPIAIDRFLLCVHTLFWF